MSCSYWWSACSDTSMGSAEGKVLLFFMRLACHCAMTRWEGCKVSFFRTIRIYSAVAARPEFKQSSTCQSARSRSLACHLEVWSCLRVVFFVSEPTGCCPSSQPIHMRSCNFFFVFDLANSPIQGHVLGRFLSVSWHQSWLHWWWSFLDPSWWMSNVRFLSVSSQQ